MMCDFINDYFPPKETIYVLKSSIMVKHPLYIDRSLFGTNRIERFIIIYSDNVIFIINVLLMR
jgi:hypothetical protein